jgi:hypothetical protein
VIFGSLGLVRLSKGFYIRAFRANDEEQKKKENRGAIAI